VTREESYSVVMWYMAKMVLAVLCFTEMCQVPVAERELHIPSAKQYTLEPLVKYIVD